MRFVSPDSDTVRLSGGRGDFCILGGVNVGGSLCEYIRR